MKDLIDFPCSGTFLNYYHEQGYTSRYDDREYLKTSKELRAEIKRLQKQRQELKLMDEEWWMQKTQDQTLQRVLDEKTRIIQAQRLEIEELRKARPAQKSTASHEGIKV
jgi:hypothetical protein